MKNILIFGYTGMLGSYVYKLLSQKYNVKGSDSNDYNIEDKNWKNLSIIIEKFDIVINCAGVIPQKTIDLRKNIIINILFPHALDKICNEQNKKIIHITTDCVFDGKKGNYDENENHNSNDVYGITKSLGETKNSTCIRTSIIGEELFGKKSLLEWLKNNKNGKINGYLNHFWNGITCLKLAEIIDKIISENNFWKGTRNIYTKKNISKYELCSIINKVYELNITIKKTNNNISKNLTLNSIYDNNVEENIEELIRKQKEFKLISDGKYKELTKCRFCDNKLKEIIKFRMPLAGGFIKNKKDYIHERIYPITLIFCKICKTGQIKEIINEDLFFKNINKGTYFYYSSSIPYLHKHFNNYSDKILLLNEQYKNVLEIGCNDGILLNYLYKKNKNLKYIGIDPSETIKNIKNKNIITYNDFFNDNTTQKILNTHGKIDIITSSNCLAHINNIKDIYKNVKQLLNKDGTFIIEVHYFKNIIDKLNFDFIYHEHMSYYSLNTFLKIAEKFNFSIENIEFIETHGGSIRVYMKNYKNYHVNPKLIKYFNLEDNLEDNLKLLFVKVEVWKSKLLKILEKEKNNKIYGYGASGRTNTILSYLDIIFDKIFDDSEYKINNYIPYYHTKILDSKEIYNLDIKTIFILAWPYSIDIIKKHQEFIKKGGKFIIILPEIKEVNINNYLKY